VAGSGRLGQRLFVDAVRPLHGLVHTPEAASPPTTSSPPDPAPGGATMSHSQRSKWIGASTSEAKLERYWGAGLYTVSCLAQGEVSEGELPVAAAEKWAESNQVEERVGHKEIVSTSAEQLLVRLARLWRSTGCAWRRPTRRRP
jgi:hypothetical protein